jgi:glucose/arabinose dehydrogenase
MRRLASRSGVAAALGIALVAAWALLGGLPSGSFPAAEAADPTLKLAEAWPGVAFASPMSTAATGDDQDRVLVALRGGKVVVLPKWRGAGPVAQPKVFLDVSNLMTEPTIEMGQGGLLCVVCAPDYRTSGRLFVSYGTGTENPANPYRTVVAMYRRGANPDMADPASGVEVISIRKSAPSHFGGGLRFGPDGMLYVGVGDSGAKFDPSGDPKKISQDLNVLEGKLLRLDVGATAPGKPYAVPADNPWAGKPGARPEIWAYGLRNPWRFSFDRDTKALWLGDPGQQKKEEIDVVPKGGNMGWAMMEADQILTIGSKPADYVAPVHTYARDFGTAVVGGVVYRGQRCASIKNHLIFADHMTGKIAALPVSGSQPGGAVKVIVDENPGIASIDEDAQGELLLSNLDDDKIYTFVPAQ